MADDTVLTEEQLNEELKSLPGWEIKEGWLRRQYKTPGFPHTMMLVNTIGYLAEAAWHHPDLSVGYAQVTVVGSSRVDLQACKLEYSIVSPK